MLNYYQAIKIARKKYFKHEHNTKSHSNLVSYFFFLNLILVIVKACIYFTNEIEHKLLSY